MDKKTKTESDLTCVRSYSRQDFRAADGDNGEKTIVGHPAVFDSQADIGGWFGEVIERGAFDDCNMDDVLFFVNHNTSKIPLARSRRNNGNSTMTLSVDNVGLNMEAKLDTENNEQARSVYSAVSRGDMDGMSFCFRIKDCTWSDLDTDYPIRHINKIAQVYEVSAVNEPAYEDTDISARAKVALENARNAVETARSAKSLENDKNEIEIYKLRNEILSK